MIKIDMDNGKRYFLENFTNYEVGNKYLVVYRNRQWIGCFSVEHLIGFFIDEEDTEEE